MGATAGLPSSALRRGATAGLPSSAFPRDALAVNTRKNVANLEIVSTPYRKGHSPMLTANKLAVAPAQGCHCWLAQQCFSARRPCAQHAKERRQF